MSLLAGTVLRRAGRALFTLSLASLGTAAAAQSPEIDVIAPRAGAVWAVGSTHTITWTHNLGPDFRFTISLLREGYGTELIAFDVPAADATTGRYDWVVTGPVTQQARIIVDFSGGGFFTIIEPLASGPGTLIQTVSGSGSTGYGGDGGPSVQAGQDPAFVALDERFGAPFPLLGDAANHRVRRI